MDEAAYDSSFGAWFGQLSADGQRTSGFALLRPRARDSKNDTVCKELLLYQFIDTERYSYIESIFTHTSPSSVYIADGCVPSSEITKVEEVLQACELASTVVSRSLFTDSDILSHIEKLTGVPCSHIESMTVALRAAACLVNKGNLLADPANFNGIKVTVGKLDQHVRLDVAVLRALNVFTTHDSVSNAGSGTNLVSNINHDAMLMNTTTLTASSSSSTTPRKFQAPSSTSSIRSLQDLLSYGCRTRTGKRIIRSWLLQPLTDIEAIVYRQNIVESFVQNTVLRKGWIESVNLPDTEAIALRLAKSKANLADMIRLYAFATALPTIVKRLRDACAQTEEDTLDMDQENHGTKRYEILFTQYIEPLQALSEEFTAYRGLVEAVVEDPTAADHPRVKRSWKESLAALGEEKDELENQCEDAYNRLVKMVDIGDDIKLFADSQRGYVFRTKKNHEKAVRAIPSVTICQVLKDGIYFTTSNLRKSAEALMEKEAEYEAEQRSVIAEAVNVARTYLPVLEAASAKIGEIDAFVSMAHAAVNAPIPYIRPRISGGLLQSTNATSSSSTPSRQLRIIQGRHPVLELQDEVSFIPNDYIMDSAPRPEAENPTTSSSSSSTSTDIFASGPGRFHLVTGPNMGGKSTYIRTLGVLCLLTQIGSFVPAQEAVLPIFDCLCARVGAGDRALKGVSTFMAEMLEAGSILTTATENSLVIIDELGRGTSTYDGFGLAWAISEYLATEIKCFSLFATHYHELTSLSDELPGIVRNLHVSAQVQDGTIIMLYTVEQGPCPSSFGIHVAELAAFPPKVIEEARRKADQLESTSAIILAKHRTLALTGRQPSKETNDEISSSSSGSTSLVATPTVQKRGTILSSGNTTDDLDDNSSLLMMNKAKRLLSLADDTSFMSESVADKRRKIMDLLN